MLIHSLSDKVRNPWYWLAFGLLIVYIRGLFLDVMDVDAAQYASISMEMLQEGNWLQVQHRHADYLDKPPLLFWTSALSFALFGLHNWAYKLPSLLGALAGVYAVYRFCLIFYTKQTARLAAFILTSSTGALLLCNDVRTDTLLMGMTACAVWCLARLANFSNLPFQISNWTFKNLYNSARSFLKFNLKFEKANLKSLAIPDLAKLATVGAAGGTFTGLAMLAKGPIGLIIPAFAVGTHLLLQRNWRGIFRWRWLVVLAVAGAVLAPMCWGLYQQFDLHPEKTVNDRTGVSGLYFYFWEQSFGRITGENVWENDTSPFYFLHVYLWAFLPWPLLLIGALWRRIGDLFRQKFRLPPGDEAYSIGAFALSFLALSLSRYKLPHYIFVTLPWAAVLLARWLIPVATDPNQKASSFSNFKFQISNLTFRKLCKVQILIYAILLTACGLLLGFVFPTENLLKWGIVLALFGAATWILWSQFKNTGADALVQSGVLVFLAIAFVLNFHFYPNLLPYQSTSAAARYAAQHKIPAERLAFFNRHGHALDFYSGRILDHLETPEQIRRRAAASGDFWLYTDEPGLARLDSTGIDYSRAAVFPHFQVTLLKPAFLNPARRPAVLQTTYLLKISAQQDD